MTTKNNGHDHLRTLLISSFDNGETGFEEETVEAFSSTTWTAWALHNTT
jgi:hypothetical protein